MGMECWHPILFRTFNRMITLATIEATFATKAGLTTRRDRCFGGDSLAIPAANATPAAVLVLLVDHPSDGLSVVLTRRTDHLQHHAGQIAFPGGKMEVGDMSPEACAVRETHEEIGLSGDNIRLLGRLDEYVTGTGFRVTPVIGVTRPPLSLIPHESEVAEVFQVPLDFLMNAANHQRHSRIINDKPRPFWAIPYESYFIWGATAGMLINFYRLFTDTVADDPPGGQSRDQSREQIHG